MELFIIAILFCSLVFFIHKSYGLTEEFKNEKRLTKNLSYQVTELKRELSESKAKERPVAVAQVKSPIGRTSSSKNPRWAR